MASATPHGLTESEIRQILEMPKTMLGDLDWDESPTNSNFLSVSENLLDDTGATIPGLSAQLVVRRGRYSHDCRFDFGIFKVMGPRKLRVYQINVRPPSKRSHRNANGTWLHGPHQHFGERAETFEPPLTLGCEDHEKWFGEFLKRAKISFGGKYLPPIQETLF